MDTPTLLITGGAGFVLAHVVAHYLRVNTKGFVIIFDLEQSCNDVKLREFFATFIAENRLRFFKGSVIDKDAWTTLEQDSSLKITHIVSGAAITPTDAEESGGAAANVLSINLFGLVNALEFARRRCPDCRFVSISSGAVYTYPGLVFPLPHTIAQMPDINVARPESMSTYCLSKFAGEAVVARWSTLFNLDACSVRFGSVYGELDRDTGARNRHNGPYWVCKAAVNNETVVVRGDLDDVGGDWICAPDVGKAVVAILGAETKPQKKVYHIGTGRAVSHRELLSSVFRNCKVYVPFSYHVQAEGTCTLHCTLLFIILRDTMIIDTLECIPAISLQAR